MADRHLEALCEMLGLVVDQSADAWRHSPNDLYEFLAAHAPPLRQEQLERKIEEWRASHRVRIDAGRPVYLPPFDDEAAYVALLVMKWTFGNGGDQNGQQSIRLQMVREGARNLGFKVPLQAVCLHYDGPNAKPWEFFHVQLGQRVTPGFNRTYHETPEWLPKNLPRTPLPVRNPPELLFSMIIGLYGTDHKIVTTLIRNLGKKLWKTLSGAAMMEM